MAGEPDGGEGHHHDNSFYAILFLFMSLFVGAISRHLLAKLPIPYTVFLLVWGIIFGLLESYVGPTVGESWGNPFHEAVVIWLSMTPHLLLYTFLPILLFASAFSMDWHIFKVCFSQCLTLAGPGVVISTTLTALFSKFVLPYEWSWPQSLLAGAILSATDPVAVVALLKEVGASKKLGIVIEGESLLNDGTAFVLFLVFQEMVQGKDLGAVDILIKFVQLALGGPLVGILFGLAATWWLSRIFNDACLEISITLMLAYLCFFTAEGLLGVSSVLAIVTCGVFMSAFGRTRITPSVEHPMEVFWEMLEYLANTVIFVYSGLKVGVVLADDSTADTAVGIQGVDWGWCILLYVALQLIRGVTVALLFPILQRMGYGLTWRTAVVMTWGGPRGAMGLALVLIISLDNTIDHQFRILIEFLVAMIAVLTIVVNGTSMPYLLEALGILKVSLAKEEFLQHSLQEMNEYTDKRCEHLKHDDLMGDPDWALVKELTHIPTAKIEKQRKLKGISAAPSDIPPEPEIIQVDGAQCCVCVDGEHMVDARMRFLSIVKTTYAEGFEKGYIKGYLLNSLTESADRCLDDCLLKIRDWDFLEGSLQLPRWLTVLNNWHLLKSVGPDSRDCGRRMRSALSSIPRDLLFDKLRDCAVVAMAFVFAHSEARHSLDRLAQEETKSGSTPAAEAAKSSYKKMILESSRECERAYKYIDGLRKAYPEVMRMIKTQLTAHTVLMHKRRFVKSIVASGLLDERECSEMEDRVNASVKRLVFMNRRPQVQTPEEILYTSTVFAKMDRDDFDQLLLPTARHQVIKAGEAVDVLHQHRARMSVFSKSLSRMNLLEDSASVVNGSVLNSALEGEDQVTQVFCITRGFVLDSAGQPAQKVVQLGPGSVVGLLSAVTAQPVLELPLAETNVEGFFISVEKLNDIFDGFPEVEECALRNIGQRLLQECGGNKDRFFSVHVEGMGTAFTTASMIRVSEDAEICMRKKQLGLLVTGQLKCVTNGGALLTAPYALDPEYIGKSVQAVGEARILMLSKLVADSSNINNKAAAVGINDFKPAVQTLRRFGSNVSAGNSGRGFGTTSPPVAYTPTERIDE